MPLKSFAWANKMGNEWKKKNGFGKTQSVPHCKSYTEGWEKVLYHNLWESHGQVRGYEKYSAGGIRNSKFKYLFYFFFQVFILPLTLELHNGYGRDMMGHPVLLPTDHNTF